MFSKITLVLILVIFISGFFCGRRNKRPDREQRQRQRQRQRPNGLHRRGRQFSQAVNDFGISLYKELSQAADNVNLVVAPVSALTAMSMVMYGAVGETEQNLFEGLKLQPLQSAARVPRAFKHFTRSFSGPLENVTFDTGNAMYVRPGQSINGRFRRKVKKFYDAESKYFDFSHPDGPEAPINEWIEMKTRGMIRNFLSNGDIMDDTLMWLLNAVYFKGTWAWIFEESMTRQQDFQVGPSQQVQVDMMHNDYSYSTKYSPDLQVRVLELPYVGDRFSFFIFLPDGVGLANLESSLNYTSLEGLLTNLHSPSRHMISVPKFKVVSTLDLVSSLQSLGVSNVFERYVADLSRINGQTNLFVDKVKQKAVLEVNERGTVAAAVTGVRVTATSLPPQFIVNRPFMYVLRDKTKATNLFIGRVLNPTTEM